MQSFIRWSRSDAMKLSKAVSRFNKLVRELEAENLDYLPEIKSYQQVKGDILSRNELNRVLKSLSRATRENLSESYTFDSGEEVSKYEWKEINLAKRRAFRNLGKERSKILSERQSIGMGDERLSEIRSMETSFTLLGYKEGKDFRRTVNRIYNIGRMDAELRKAETFRKNFYTSLENLSSFENYDKLKEKLDKIKNPISFYEYVKQSPILMDIFLWYKNKETTNYGGFESNEEAFDSSLVYHLGITDIDV